MGAGLSTSLVGFLIALAVAFVIAFPLGSALKKHSMVFYLGALVIVCLYVWSSFAGVNLSGVRALTMGMQKGYVASILFAIVMFTGCLDEAGALRKKLQPIRGELSILASILVLGHLGVYLPRLLPNFAMYLSLRGSMAVSLIVALVLTVVFGVLAITSIRAVRRVMRPATWKAVQRFSYCMVGLLLVHVVLALGKSSAGAGAAVASVSLTAYVVVIAVYAVLRIRKTVIDHRRMGAEVVNKQPA